MNEKIRLLIGYDGSAYSKQALNDLRRAALPTKCEALVVSVCDAVVPRTQCRLLTSSDPHIDRS